MGIGTYAKHVCRRRRDRVTPTPTSKNPKYSQQTKEKTCTLSCQRIYSTHARHSFSAGVQAMRARICSAFSCDMFARVVWLKSWGMAKLSIFALPFAARTRHAWLARLTRARGKSSQREGNALFNDFWYFSSLKSTIKEKLHYDSSRANNVRPYAQNPSIANRQSKRFVPTRFFFCTCRRKRKSYQKENADIRISHSAECDKGSAL